MGKWDKKAASTLKKGDKKGAIAEKFTDGAKLYVAQVCARVHACVCILCSCARACEKGLFHRMLAWIGHTNVYTTCIQSICKQSIRKYKHVSSLSSIYPAAILPSLHAYSAKKKKSY